MKIFSNIKKAFLLLPLWGFGGLVSCQKDEIKAVLTSGVVPAVAVSSQTLVLTKEKADQDALTISWAKPDYGFAAAPSYTVYLDKKGGDFKNGVAISTGADLKKTFKTSELNGILLKLGLKAATAAAIDTKVVATIGTASVFTSAINSITTTPYLDKLDLSSNWGVVGSGYNNWGAFADAPFYKTSTANVYVSYVTLIDGEIKFRQDNKWDLNYGATGNAIVKDGSNIAVKAGTYKILLDLNTLKYTIEKYSWGVVGSAYNNWGATPDFPFFYDPSSDQFRAIVPLAVGEYKIRLNNDWGVNYGYTGKDGILDAGGDNLVAKAGTYLITMDLKSLKFTVEAYKVWGIVGSATPNGWNGPDSKFTPDFGTEGIWNLSGFKLIDGEIKLRQNDDWTVNYGSDKADGKLNLNGGNIAVKAGTYHIQLDFSNANAPIYKITKQ